MARTKRFASINFARKEIKKTSRSKNHQLLLLGEFFTKLSKLSSDIKFHKIAKKLKTSRINRAVVKITRIAKEAEQNEGKVFCVVAKVLDDDVSISIPAMNIVALQWSHSVKEKIEKAGRSITTLDQFSSVCPNIDDLVLISGDVRARLCAKYQGLAPGIKGSMTYPRTNERSKNREKRLWVKKK